MVLVTDKCEEDGIYIQDPSELEKRVIRFLFTPISDLFAQIFGRAK